MLACKCAFMNAVNAREHLQIIDNEVFKYFALVTNCCHHINSYGCNPIFAPGASDKKHDV